jgi:hypothetical protein
VIIVSVKPTFSVRVSVCTWVLFGFRLDLGLCLLLVLNLGEGFMLGYG